MSLNFIPMDPLIGLLIAVIVIGLLIWLIRMLPLPEPWGVIAQVIAIIIAILYLIRFL